MKLSEFAGPGLAFLARLIIGRKATGTARSRLLDRVAPLCFAAPVFFHSVRCYFGV